jgi:hypothetical protein
MRLGASYRHFEIPDCIYRRALASAHGHPEYLYAAEESIFGSLHPADAPRIEALAVDLAKSMPPESEIISPLALGNHVDHCLVRAAVERTGRSLWYYADYPYVLRHLQEIEELASAGWEKALWPISPGGLAAWKESVAAHRSQISTFWPDLASMRADLEAYLGQNGGLVLWRSP